MNDEQLRQRIQYLIEHGGMLDDPIADLRRGIRWAVALGGLALALDVVLIAMR